MQVLALFLKWALDMHNHTYLKFDSSYAYLIFEKEYFSRKKFI
jgi:hypothetical protein